MLTEEQENNARIVEQLTGLQITLWRRNSAWTCVLHSA